MTDHIDVSKILKNLTKMSRKDGPEDTLGGFIKAINQENLPISLSRTGGSEDPTEKPISLESFKNGAAALFQTGRFDELSPEDRDRLKELYDLLDVVLENQILRREKKLLQRQVEESARYITLGQLSRGVAHDFNNYLAGILGYTDLALRKAEEGSPARQMLELIHENSLKTADFVKQLLQLTRKQGAPMESLSMAGIIEEVFPLLKHLVKGDIEITTSLGEDLWPFEGDASQLEQLIINLFLNAREALPRGGCVTITAENYSASSGTLPGGTSCRPGGYVCVTVTDTGCGITPENLAFIFEPFYTTQDPGRGPGLGLTRARTIMQDHSGYIEVESAPSRGSRFHLYFPGVGQMGEEAGETPSCQLSQAHPLALLVEDEPIVLDMVTFLLETSGFDVLSCEDPLRGTEIFRENRNKISLVISDMVMPNMTGDELVRRLRGYEPEIRIVLMSGYGDDTIKSRLDEKTRFIQKPFNLETFSQVVKEVMVSR